MELSMGQMMFFGGIAGAVVSGILLIICLKIFSKMRRKELIKIMEDL